MKPYNVEIFTPDFTLVGHTNINELSYREDYLSSDENFITVFAIPGVKKQDYIRISRGKEEYSGIITEIAYGTDKSKNMQTISYKPLIELLNTDMLFDVNAQGTGTFEQFIADTITDLYITNEDTLQNIKGLSVVIQTETTDWDLHITPSEKGGHYNIVNLMDSVIVPALQKYHILLTTKMDIQNKQLLIIIGKVRNNVVTIESDLPNILKKNVVFKQVSADVNKLIIYDAADDYATRKLYYLHTDLGYDTKDEDRILPVVCDMRVVSSSEELSFESLAQNEAANTLSKAAFSNLIELTMRNEDELIRPEEMSFGQIVNVISDGNSYQSILTGREIGKNTKLIFGTVRLELTKILRRNG
mgnify:CR=1 FL=1